METQQTHDSPSKTVLEVLRTMNEFAATTNNSPGYANQVATAADAASARFLGFERTPLNILFGKTIIVAFFAQFVLFYTAWWLNPSFTKNRRGLAWVLTFCSACWLLFTTSSEFGYLRTPLWSYLGWEQSGGVGPDGSTSTANIFSYWLPSFHAWALQLGADSRSILLQDITFENLLLSLSSVESAKVLLSERLTVKALAGKYLRWLMSLPIFSLAPLKPPPLISETAPYFLGGGGRLLFSGENFPRESVWSSLLCGYFVGYCAGDLVIGWMHYSEHIGLASGYLHHLFYTWLIWQLGCHGQLSVFLIAGGVLEVSTIFLASGYMYPHLREDFWFPFTFFLVRILFVGLMLHEGIFNYDSPRGGIAIYSLAFLLHVFWFNKYLQGLRRRTRKAQKELQEKEEQEKKKQEQHSESHLDIKDSGADGERNSTTTATKTTNGLFQLRVKKTKSCS
ncbi:hypothetical protein BG015_000577 [Linnemannia schmuckeri]|uniref:TLC domain-containing protein n=1 Tax=Linnemannia schmuckeri TaxID=64567 RepID=A0A9P5V706_9FUNG|nr:hypothetical protein BG015_000577 [Linnemannia schmuckeri]